MSVGEVPDIAILLNGTELTAAEYADLLSVEVQDDLEGPSQCTISLVAWSDEQLGLAYVDDERFDVGNELEVKLGYVDALESIGDVEVVSLDIDVSSGSHPHLTVRGYDWRHRLRRGTKIRTFANMKDSDIASQIAKENGLSATVEDSGLKREELYQDGKSDFEFLTERAEQIGYEVVVIGKELFFRVPKGSSSPIAIAADTDLTDLSAHVRAADQVGSVEVRGWDPETKKAVVGTSGSAKLPDAADGDAAFGKAVLVIVDRAITKQDDADKAAVAAWEHRARRSMTIEGSCLGRTDLRSGVEIDLQGIGTRFGGVYRLTSVSHKFSAKGGYVTSFSGTRKLT